MTDKLFVVVFKTKYNSVFKALYDLELPNEFYITEAIRAGKIMNKDVFSIDHFHDQFKFTMRDGSTAFIPKEPQVHVYNRPDGDTLIVPVFPTIVAIKKALVTYAKSPELLRTKTDQQYHAGLTVLCDQLQSALRSKTGFEVRENLRFNDDAVPEFDGTYSLKKCE